MFYVCKPTQSSVASTAAMVPTAAAAEASASIQAVITAVQATIQLIITYTRKHRHVFRSRDLHMYCTTTYVMYYVCRCTIQYTFRIQFNIQPSISARVHF